MGTVNKPGGYISKIIFPEDLHKLFVAVCFLKCPLCDLFQFLVMEPLVVQEPVMQGADMNGQSVLVRRFPADSVEHMMYFHLSVASTDITAVGAVIRYYAFQQSSSRRTWRHSLFLSA